MLWQVRFPPWTLLHSHPSCKLNIWYQIVKFKYFRNFSFCTFFKKHKRFIAKSSYGNFSRSFNRCFSGIVAISLSFRHIFNQGKKHMYYAVFYVCGRVTVVCTVCEAEIKSREYTTELTLSQKNAVICAYDEISFWHCGPNFLIHDVLVDFMIFLFRILNLPLNI